MQIQLFKTFQWVVTKASILLLGTLTSYDCLLQTQEYLNIVYIIIFLLFISKNTIYNSYLVIGEDLLPFL